MTTLACPKTRQPLRLIPIGEARDFCALRPGGVAPSHFLLREDGEAAYPVVDGIPILLAPEMFVRSAGTPPFDVTLAPYAEAYEERSFYDGLAAKGSELAESSAMLRRLAAARAEGMFPEPPRLWIDAEFDGSGQLDCYRHLAPNMSGVVMQLGGKGLHAVKFLLAGAREAWLLTPMLEEARWALALAGALGVRERLRVVVGVAEEMPFADAQFDAVYAGGTMHHLVIGTAAAELHRVLRSGGRLAACEPWRAPGYAWGVRILGKREPSVHCRPIDARRLAVLLDVFPAAAAVHHGALLRYPLIALGKLGVHLGVATVLRLIRIDDALSSLVPPVRRNGSSVAILASKR